MENAGFLSTASQGFWDRIGADELRRAILPEPQPTQHLVACDASGEALIKAAVLLPVVVSTGGLSVLFTRRTARLTHHPGQICFPGGRVEPDDVSPSSAVLREVKEEIGLSSERVEIIGYLPQHCTRTGFSITPVVALVTPPLDLSPNPYEVAEVFEAPLNFLLNPANHQRISVDLNGRKNEFYAVSYGPYFIWGATAGMIRSLSDRLSEKV